MFLRLQHFLNFSQASEAELDSFSADDIKDLTPPQVVEFLAQLVDKVSTDWTVVYLCYLLAKRPSQTMSWPKEGFLFLSPLVNNLGFFFARDSS